MPLHHDHPQRQSERLWRAHKRGWAVFLVLLMTSTALVKENALNLRLSLLSLPEHAPFDGTVMPIQNVPDWLEASEDERSLTYNEFPSSKLVEIPSYAPSRLREDTNALEWGDPYDDHTRLMKITYPVPYAGSYQFDGIEGLGSHPAVDIKALKGTPVYAMANGVVEKVSYSNAGFGNLIVVKHNRVPSPDRADAFTTLHSGYAHLSDIFVTDGEVVSKGQMIGTVGNTGTATTDHLHFQIDRDDAPWHLYWPFTSAEANQVGGFWQAINKGLNQDKMYANTINPLEYVQLYADPNAIYGVAPVFAEEAARPSALPAEDDAPAVVEESPAPAPVPVPVPVPTPAPTPSEDSGLPFSRVTVEYDPYVFLNSQQEATLSLVDDVGELVKNAPLNSPLRITVSDPAVLRVTPSELTQNSLINGVTTLSLIPLKVGRSDFTVSFFGQSYFSGEVVVPADRDPIERLALETDHHFMLGEPEPVVVVALNKSGERLTQVDLPEAVRLEVVQGQGFFSRNALVKHDFAQGLATVEFTATSDEDVVLKVSYGELEEASSILTSSLFADMPESHPYYQAVAYLKSQGVVQGYDDQTFRPDQPVSRVEALKLLFEGLEKEAVSGATLSFPDADSEAWYAPYLATAARDNVVKGYPDGTFRPASQVNRVELIKMLTGLSGVDVDPVVKGNPYKDVHYLEWYAPYAQFIKEANVAPWVSLTLDPNAPMTRGEVAEMIYRVRAILANGAERYSRTLVLN